MPGVGRCIPDESHRLSKDEMPAFRIGRLIQRMPEEAKRPPPIIRRIVRPEIRQRRPRDTRHECPDLLLEARGPDAHDARDRCIHNAGLLRQFAQRRRFDVFPGFDRPLHQLTTRKRMFESKQLHDLTGAAKNDGTHLVRKLVHVRVVPGVGLERMGQASALPAHKNMGDGNRDHTRPARTPAIAAVIGVGVILTLPGSVRVRVGEVSRRNTLIHLRLHDGSSKARWILALGTVDEMHCHRAQGRQ